MNGDFNEIANGTTKASTPRHDDRGVHLERRRLQILRTITR